MYYIVPVTKNHYFNLLESVLKHGQKMLTGGAHKIYLSVLDYKVYNTNLFYSRFGR